MSASAVVLMIVAMVLLWGGLVAVILFLRARPETGLVEPSELVAQDEAREQQPHPTRDT
ncbi:methionine/alanine import family NSS transporter small subunit [Gordonia iterans]